MRHPKHLIQDDFDRGNAGTCWAVIYGCSGGATTFCARVLEAVGVKAGHERDGKDVHVGWYAMPWAEEWPVRILQIRDPRKVVGVIAGRPVSEIQENLEYANRFLRTKITIDPADKYAAAISYVYQWYTRGVTRAQWVYRVEDMRDALPGLLRQIGKPAAIARIPEAEQALKTPRNSRQGRPSRKDKPYPTWGEIRERPYGEELHHFAGAHGYV